MGKNQKKTTAHFKIVAVEVPKLIPAAESGTLYLGYEMQYLVKKRILPFWWRTEKYLKHSNDGPGRMKPYVFKSPKEALEYINRTNYSTKVLWSDV